jgi:DNA repair exonuclease SbcCD ATPase subunit
MRIVMQRVSTAAALLAAALLTLPQVVSAQSLGEAAERAKRERERRGGKPKVITDQDLRSAGSRVQELPVSSSENEPAEAAPAAEGTTTTTTTTDGTPAAAPAKAEKTEDELRAEAEAKWRERLQQARAEVSRLSAEAAQLQTSLNDLTTNVYGSNRAATMTRLDEVKKQLSTAQQSVTDLEEEGRRSRFRQ